MEYVDIYDCNYNHIGQEEKEKAHKQGMWHSSFHCWIIRPNNKILFQLRSKDKTTYPDRLDISAAGHLSAGEEIIDGIREINEELGIEVIPDELTYLGYKQHAKNIPTKNGMHHNREFQHTFILKNDIPLTEDKLQEEELDGIFEIDIQDALALFNEETNEIQAIGFLINNGIITAKTRTVNKSHFVSRPKWSYLKILIMAERYINGEKLLAI